MQVKIETASLAQVGEAFSSVNNGVYNTFDKT